MLERVVVILLTLRQYLLPSVRSRRSMETTGISLVSHLRRETWWQAGGAYLLTASHLEEL